MNDEEEWIVIGVGDGVGAELAGGSLSANIAKLNTLRDVSCCFAIGEIP